MVKKYLTSIFLVFSVALIILLISVNAKEEDKLTFATSPDYPPFEYKTQGELTGFDIEIGKLIGKQLGKKIEFKETSFSALLLSLENDQVDAVLSTMTVTKERKKNFDFSIPYYQESLSMIFNKKNPLKNKEDLEGKTIGCQMATTMEIWLKKHTKNTKIITFDTNPQAVEALKAGHVDGVFIDSVQAQAFTEKNLALDFELIAQADNGYALAFKKGSPLVKQINEALSHLETQGEIDKLKKKYLEIK